MDTQEHVKKAEFLVKRSKLIDRKSCHYISYMVYTGSQDEFKEILINKGNKVEQMKPNNIGQDVFKLEWS